MVARVFKLDLDEDVVLQLLGAALVLRWSALPTALQDEIVQQVQAMAGDEPRHPKLRGHLLKILKRADGIGGGLPSGQDS
jgi:hypothetical protein